MLRQHQELNNHSDAIRKALIEGKESGNAKTFNADEFKQITAAKYQQWCQENKQVIAQHNLKIKEKGTFSEKIAQL